MRKYVTFEIDGGIGKNIIATQVVQAIKAKWPEHEIVVITGHDGVWLHNPNVYRVYLKHEAKYIFEDYVDREDSVCLANEVYRSQGFIKGTNSLAQSWCQMLGVTYKNQKPKIYLTQKEIQAAQFGMNRQPNRGLMVIQPYGGGNDATATSWFRNMPIELAQNIVNHFTPKYDVVQVKLPNQLQLNNCNHFTSDNQRDVVALLPLADKVVCIDSFVQHACAAIGKSATVLFPTKRQARIFGHKIHDNIVASGDYDSFMGKHSLYEPFNIAGIPQEFPYTGDGKMYDLNKIITKLQTK